MNEIPVIELSDAKQRLTHCSACGTEDKPLKQFAIKTSQGSRQTVAYCQECSRKIVSFLAEMWKD